MKKVSSMIVCVAMVVLMTSSSYAGVAANLMLTNDGQLVIAEGACNDADSYVAYPVQVLLWTFDEAASGNYFYQNHPAITSAGSDQSSNNSLYSSDFQYLPGNTDVYFAFDAFNLSGTMTNLAYWDGSGEVSFTPVSDGATLSIELGTGESASVDGSSSDVAGYAIGTTSEGGHLHLHPGHYLRNNGAAPAEGVYLWCMELSMPSTDYPATEPFFVAMNTPGFYYEGLESDVETWVGDNADALLSPVPEPSSWVLLCSVGLGGLWLRKRGRVVA